jgi:hypothetical protein
MAYFITASASSSVVQTTFDTTGSIITSSLYTPNDPLNVDNITTIKKSRSAYPNLNRPIYKESVSFTNCDGTDINWLYDNTASRDSDFNIIKTLNTNYNPDSITPSLSTDLLARNITASGDISASGALISGKLLLPSESSSPTGVYEGQIALINKGGSHYIYVFVGGAWKSSSLA